MRPFFRNHVSLRPHTHAEMANCTVGLLTHTLIALSAPRLFFCLLRFSPMAESLHEKQAPVYTVAGYLFRALTGFH